MFSIITFSETNFTIIKFSETSLDKHFSLLYEIQSREKKKENVPLISSFYKQKQEEVSSNTHSLLMLGKFWWVDKGLPTSSCVKDLQSFFFTSFFKLSCTIWLLHSLWDCLLLFSSITWERITLPLSEHYSKLVSFFLGMIMPLNLRIPQKVIIMVFIQPWE